MAAASVISLVPWAKPAAPPEPTPVELTLKVEPPHATILVDGAPSEKQITHKPGQVKIEVQADGYVPQVLLDSFASGPQSRNVVLQRAAPHAYTVAIAIDPAGTEIFEGSRLIGKSPKVWSGAPAGEHELTFRHDGYREEQGRIAVAKDGDEFRFKPLRKIETKKSAPELGIKAER
jgi:hypothetical protein